MTIPPVAQQVGSIMQCETLSTQGTPCHTAARTPLTLSVKSDIHTSDLTEACPHKVLLRHEQKTRPIATTALFRGLLAGKALERIHQGGEEAELINRVESSGWTKAIRAISSELTNELEEEGRSLSDSVIRNMKTIEREVISVVEQYTQRFMPLFNQCDLIGTELPCRLVINETNFASHIDLLVRDVKNVFGYGADRLLCIDWKYRQTAPTKAYLARNLQMHIYWLTILEGAVMAYKAVDGWVKYSEIPQMIWCHLPYLKPFGRKTIIKNKEGVEVEYKKGDERPIDNIMRPVNLKPEAINIIKADLLDRVAMMRSGFFPKNPDPVGCQICEAQDFCTRGDTPELMENK